MVTCVNCENNFTQNQVAKATVKKFPEIKDREHHPDDKPSLFDMTHPWERVCPNCGEQDIIWI